MVLTIFIRKTQLDFPTQILQPYMGFFNRNVSVLFQHTEALLYGFQSIAETIDVNYSDVIPGLIGLIPRININNVQLADTVMFTIGVCACVSALL